MTTINQPTEISITEGVAVPDGEVIILSSDMHHMVSDHVSDEHASTYERFEELCADLNLDVATKENTWRTFVSIKEKFTLEVNIDFDLAS